MGIKYDFNKFCKKAILKYGYEDVMIFLSDDIELSLTLEDANGYINPNEEVLEEVLIFLDRYFLNRDKTIDATKIKKLLELEVGGTAGVLSKYKNTYWKYTKVENMKFNFTYIGR